MRSGDIASWDKIFKRQLGLAENSELNSFFLRARASFAIPLACYRIGFGPPARNREKIGKI